MLASLAADPGLLNSTAMRCRQRALTHFSADRMVADYALLYDELKGAGEAAVREETGRGVCAA